MPCPACGHENPPPAKFCIECGTRLVLRCPACEAELPPGAKFCPECGTPVSDGARPAATAPAGRFGAVPVHPPAHLAERILTSRTALEGERKQVTVLFADLKGSMELLGDHDPEDARRLLDPVLERMMESVHRYEGTVNQVMGDGIMAIFGAPIAHEDHAVRACYAALHLQESIRQYGEELRRAHGVPLHLRVGLNSGEVVVRSVGSDLRMDYSAVGQTTNLAARMEQTALPGTIQITPRTLQLAEGFVEVKPLGPMAIKGLPEPLEVYEVTGAGRARSRLHALAARGLTRFVGRDSELEVLRQSLERAGAGRGQIVAAIGEPGVGKSRLVWEFTHSHRAAGWLVLESSSVSYGRATAYLPVVELLRSYFQIEAGDDARRVRQKVLGKLLDLDDALRPDLPAFLTLLDVPVEDAAWATLEPIERRRRIAEAVKRLVLRECQDQPVLLVFEDLHWIDSETQALLDGLVESLPTARLLLLVNYRPEYGHGWGSKTYYTQLRLDPLSEASAEELLNTLLGPDPSIEPLKPLLIARTEGTPFFLEESVRTLVEGGVLSGEPGTYHMERSVHSVEVPATVQAVLAARIDRLAPDDKRLLQTAAVIGHEVPFALLVATADLGESELRQGLARLQSAEFLYEGSLFPELEYVFKHALTHEVAYGSLLQERRRELHGRIAAAMEAIYRGDLAEHIDPLAHHAFRGELWDKAVIYLRQAAVRATARTAHRDAVQLLGQALDAQQSLDPNDAAARCDLLLALAQAQLPLGQPRRIADSIAPEIFELAEQLSDRARASLACRLVLEALHRDSPTNTLTPEWARWAMLADAYARPGSGERAYADIALARAEIAAGHRIEGVELLERALALARELDDPELLCSCAWQLIFNGFTTRSWKRSVALAQEFVDWPRDRVQSRTVGQLQEMCGVTLLSIGDRERAERAWGELSELGARTQDVNMQLNALSYQGLVATLDGNLETTVEIIGRMTVLGEEFGATRTAGFFAWARCARALMHLGRIDELQALLPRSRPQGAEGWREALVLAIGNRREESQRAVRTYLQANQGIAGTVPEEYVPWLSHALEAAVLIEDRESAGLLLEALSDISLIAAGSGVTCIDRHLGAAAALLGQHARARHYYQQALGLSAKVRFRPETALARLQMGELLLGAFPDERAEAKLHLEFAITELRAMNMQPALERALRLRSLLQV